MTSIHTLGRLLPACLALLSAGAALAEEGGYYYGGLSLGESRSKIDQERITASLLGAGLSTSGFQRDQRGVAYRVFGGYQMTRNFALEAGYFDLGKFGFTTSTTPPGTLRGDIKLRGFNLDLVGTLPLTDHWSALARVGAQAAQARDHFSGSGAVAVLNAAPSKREVNYKFGGGLQYEFSRSFMMRIEGERYRVNDAVGNHGGINVASLSLVFPFGRSEAPASRYAAAPAYAAPPPAPAPMPMAAPPPPPVMQPAPVVMPPARRRVSFSAESLFGFDSSALKPEGRAALDKFAADARDTQFDVINVEGHTDRLGSTAYNQRLSQRRADAVKDYLVGTGGFAAGKVNTVGKGESTPVTRPGDCKGSRPTPRLTACLQPDRRVDIELTGTR